MVETEDLGNKRMAIVRNIRSTCKTEAEVKCRMSTVLVLYSKVNKQIPTE